MWKEAIHGWRNRICESSRENKKEEALIKEGHTVREGGIYEEDSKEVG